MKLKLYLLWAHHAPDLTLLKVCKLRVELRTPAVGPEAGCFLHDQDHPAQALRASEATTMIGGCLLLD